MQIVSRERYKYSEIRSAYFCWIRENIYPSAQNNGYSVKKIHNILKIKFLLPIMCSRDQQFADLVLRETIDGVTNPVIARFLSIADSSITTSEMLLEYFYDCQQALNELGVAELLETA